MIYCKSGLARSFGWNDSPSSRIMPRIAEELVMSDLDPPPQSNSSTLPRSAKRCRIPRLNRSVSVRTPLDPLTRSEAPLRPKSLTVGSADYPWTHLGSSMHSMGTTFDDECSVKSFGSYASYASFASQSQCGTEASSRPVSRSHYGKRYVLHCDRHMVKPEEYLTPTQRKEKEIRQLKSALARQTKRCDDKDREIEGLRGEMRRLADALEELQLGKHSLMNSSQESDNLNEKNNSSVISFESNSSDDMHTVATNHNDDSGISTSISPRNSSEEFDEIVGDKVDKCVCTDDCLKAEVDYSKPKTEVNVEYPKSKPEVESVKPKTEVILKSKAEMDYLKPEVSVDYAKAAVDDGVVAQRVGNGVTSLESHQMLVAPSEFEKFLAVYKQELEQLKSQHKEHYQDLKERFNDRVDDLLQKLTEANTRYLELRPLFDRAQDKIHTIESQLCDVQKDMESQEEYHNQMYLRMYRKGQEAARFIDEEDGDSHPKTLRQQLQQLENELETTRRLYREATTRGSGDRQAEYTLRFLKDAVFYFLTKKDKEHLKAIQSILGFTDAERVAVAKAMKHRRL